MDHKKNEESKNRHNLNYKKVKSNREEDAYIQDNEYYFLFEREMKDECELFRCKHYRKNSKCPAYLKIKNNSIKEKSIFHNHSPDEKKCSKIIIKTNIKNLINGTNNVYNLSVPKLYINEITKINLSNIRQYSTVKSPLYRTLNKNIPEEV